MMPFCITYPRIAEPVSMTVAISVSILFVCIVTITISTKRLLERAIQSYHACQSRHTPRSVYWLCSLKYKQLDGYAVHFVALDLKQQRQIT
jgi:hypothetical protein